MKYQPWLSGSGWKKEDPKLKEAASQPCRLSHTSGLAEIIAVKPAGIIMVRGPRQVGKSTFLREFANKCLKSGVAPDAIVLFDAERFANRYELLGSIEQFLQNRKEYSVLLFDEITSLDEWWLAVKAAADRGLFANALVLCTGSSSFDLAKGADLMPGRRGKRYPVDYELLPVTYGQIKKRLNIDEFLLTGGFPWSVNEYLRLGMIPAYVYNVYASWIEGVFHKQRHSVQQLPLLLQKLSVYQAAGTSVTRLARDCGIGSNSTAENFIFALESMYGLLSCPWADPSHLIPAPRKNRKFYPFDPFLFHLFADFGKGWESAWEASVKRLQDPALKGRMVEGLVASQLRKRAIQPLRYWQGKKEIDFVGKEMIEVKYQEHVSADEFAWVNKIISPRIPFTVITKNNTARKGNIELITLKDWLNR